MRAARRVKTVEVRTLGAARVAEQAVAAVAELRRGDRGALAGIMLEAEAAGGVNGHRTSPG